jgi:hypothetical protein
MFTFQLPLPARSGAGRRETNSKPNRSVASVMEASRSRERLVNAAASTAGTSTASRYPRTAHEDDRHGPVYVAVQGSQQRKVLIGRDPGRVDAPLDACGLVDHRCAFPGFTAGVSTWPSRIGTSTPSCGC